VGRVLQTDAPFVITVPSDCFTEFLGGAGFFEGLGLESMADGYRRFFNRISRHAHTDPPEVWAARLAEAGFAVERWQYYFSKDALHALEIGHAQGVPSAVLHALTGHWILGPWESNLKRTEQWVRPYYEEPFPAKGAYIFFLARKQADGAIPAELPQAQPYSLTALQEGEARATAVPGEEFLAAAPIMTESTLEAGTSAEAAAIEVDSPPTSARRSRLIIPALLAGLTLLFAYFGQAALRATPEQPGTGLRWFAISAIPLLLLLWQQREPGARARAFAWPSLREIETRRWYLLPALILSFLAQRLVAPDGIQRPWLALPAWVIAIGIAYYALGQTDVETKETPTRAERRERLTDFRTAVLLFLLALLPRIYELGRLPFVLNGAEASFGLEALNVLSGAQQNPFTTGWLTNPTLPFFALALPVGLLGPSTETIRLFSALIGAATVPALFLIGKQLYGSVVGLSAAILLAGSHFHLQFSRLGLTNVWDALVVLLALGLIAIAWQRDPRQNRAAWLAAGTAVGFSAYLYSSAHLLPLMLFFLAVLLVLLDRPGIRKQWSGIFAMVALALVIALPILLHYLAAPELFMERAAQLGMLGNQSGRLAQEALLNNSSQMQIMLQQFTQAALAFNATIDQSTYYGALVPFLNFVAGMFAAIGFLLALVRLRQIRYNILVVWVLVTILFAGALLDNPPSSHRYIIAAPAVMLLAAQALVELVRALTIGRAPAQTEVASKQSQLAYLLIPLFVAAAIALYDVGYYFGPYRSEHHFADRNTEIADRMAAYLNGLEGDWSAHFYGPPSMYVDFPTIPFLARNFVKGDNLFDVPEGGLQLPLPEGGNETFLFLPERYGELEPLRAAHPAGTERSISGGYYADPLFYVYEIRDMP
jgi:4-amino-4-deoxy-L-arabinose transferase-like glycosyltransferase